MPQIIGNNDSTSTSVRRRSVLARFRDTGPAWLSSSLNIGGGSVTTAIILSAATGFKYGWVLFLAVITVWIAIYACVKISLISGKNPVAVMRENAHPSIAWANGFALLLTNTIFHGTQVALGAAAIDLVFPKIGYRLGGVIFVGLVALISFGSKSIQKLERFLKYLLIVLVFTYLASVFFVDIDWSGLASMFKFAIPTSQTDILQFTAVMGMCLAFNIPVIQAYGSVSRGWRQERLSTFRFETALTNVMWLITCMSIVIVVASTLYMRGVPATGFADAAQSLRPIAGNFSAVLLAIGMFGAVLTTAVVHTTVAGYVVTDLAKVETSITNRWFRVAQVGTVLFGLSIPIFGWNAFSVVVWGSAFNVTFMALGIGTWWYLINKREVMREHKAGIAFNIMLGFCFTVALITIIRFWYVTL